MAYQVIGTYRVHEYEQEEIIEKKLVANEETGVVEEVEELVQQYIHTWVDLVVKQNILEDENRSDFRAELTYNAEAGKNGKGFYYGISNYYYYHPYNGVMINDWITSEKQSNIGATVAPGGSYTTTIYCDTITNQPRYEYVGYPQEMYYWLDGSPVNSTLDVTVYLSTYIDDELSGERLDAIEDEVYGYHPNILPNDRAVKCNTADNFTDENDASFSYKATTGKSIHSQKGESYTGYNLLYDRVISLQAALSFDGSTADIAFRDIPINNTAYAFDLTEAERELLRQKAQGSNTVPIYYLIKVIREVGDGINTAIKTAQMVSATERVLTIVGCEPVITPTVKDVNARTVYLTGNENVFVRYKSIAEYSINAVASKYATIVQQQVINGSSTITNEPTGTIDGVDSNTFYFAATDSRGLTARDALVRELVPYIKLTSRISAADLNTDGELSFTVTGNYYNGSFGAVDNSLQFEYSIIKDGGDIEWYIIEPEVTFKGNTYTFTYTINNLDYRSKYTITANVIDEAMNAETEAKVITSIPVFDWSADDFKHNTKVYFEEDIELASGKTINGFNFGSNKVLWSGALHMNANQSISLAEPISAQANGIVLVFSLYRNNAADNVSINSAFVSKQEVELLSGAPHTFWMAINAGFSSIGAKYLYIDNTSISGHEGNTSSGTNSGISYNNSSYVLRYVIGI